MEQPWAQKMAPSYANTFMNNIEQDFLNSQPITPLLWKRYIDDIFAIWNDTKETLMNFLQRLNEHHPTLKYTYEISEHSVDFLDVTIHKGKQFQKTNHLDVKTFFKKTNTFQYLHYKSAHPPSTRKAVIIGEANRFRRTNSNPEDFNQTISELTKHLSDRDYPQQLITENLAKVPFNPVTDPNPTKKEPPLIFRTTWSQLQILPTIDRLTFISSSLNLPLYRVAINLAIPILVSKASQTFDP